MNEQDTIQEIKERLVRIEILLWSSIFVTLKPNYF